MFFGGLLQRLTFTKLAVVAAAMLTLCGAMAREANARVFFGVGVPLYLGPPAYVPPPVYYPPYYAPPMVYERPGSTFSYTPPSMPPQNLAPPTGYNSPGGYTPSMGGARVGGGPVVGAPIGAAQACEAGPYVCPLMEETPPGGACACPTHDGKRIRGRAN